MLRVRIPTPTLKLVIICESVKGYLLSVYVFEQAVIDGEQLALPWRYAGLELVRYGGVMLQLKSEHGYVLTFTPQSNEFTISVPSSATAGHTAGLCGNINTDSLIQNIPVHLSLLASITTVRLCTSSDHRSLSVSSFQVPVGRINLTSCLYVMAAQPLTSRPSSQTGLWL